MGIMRQHLLVKLNQLCWSFYCSKFIVFNWHLYTCGSSSCVVTLSTLTSFNLLLSGIISLPINKFIISFVVPTTNMLLVVDASIPTDDFFNSNFLFSISIFALNILILLILSMTPLIE